MFRVRKPRVLVLYKSEIVLYKSKLELKSNSSDILPVNCKIICDSKKFNLTKHKLEVLKSDFQRRKERYEHR